MNIRISIGQDKPFRRDRWTVRFCHTPSLRHEVTVKSYSEAERIAIEYAAAYERDGAQVELSLNLG